MLALSIVSTIFIGVSCITSIIRNACIFSDEEGGIHFNLFFFFSFWGLAWRALVIATIWVLYYCL